ncbi:hypothetical protein HYT32_01980 [Candidatus Roizmanbacteria bacterium]|nr:hypothetical protein [Candidatus Roizmanbacteria bacterium]
MKILIGTPVNEVKDYCMERWVANVSKLRKEYPADFLMVDNSPGLDYVKKLEEYCKNYGIKSYKIKHLEIGMHQPSAEKIGRSREIIRQEILASDYDAWFSWECDQIIPTYTLGTLVKIMKAGSYMMIHPNSWAREIPTEPNASFGCALINRKALEKYGFLLECPNMPDCWHGGENWFKKQVLKGGGSYIEVYGVINPIYHLNK